MIKKLLTLIVSIFLCLPASALMLQGNAQFNTELAREETFNNLVYSIDKNEFQNHMYDPNHIANYTALQNGENKLYNRYLSMFSDGTYGVRYIEDPYHNYYYDQHGSLFKFDVLNKPFNVYPHRSIAYDTRGLFKNATFVISKDEQYLYDANKKLMGHWIENACYDDKGNILMLRKNAQ